VAGNKKASAPNSSGTGYHSSGGLSSTQNILLASIAEVEQQSEMYARVSTWKERIEHALEEQVCCWLGTAYQVTVPHL